MYLNNLSQSLANLEVRSHLVGLDCRGVEDRDGATGVRGLRTDLLVSVAESTTHCLGEADLVAGVQVVLVGQDLIGANSPKSSCVAVSLGRRAEDRPVPPA